MVLFYQESHLYFIIDNQTHNVGNSTDQIHNDNTIIT